MDVLFLIYCLIYLVASLVTLLPAKQDKSLYAIAVLLLFSLVEELILRRTHDYIVYKLYAPVYYDIFICYFIANIPSRVIRVGLTISLIVVPLVLISLSLFGNTLNEHPGLQINIVGIILIICSLIALYYMNVEDETALYRRPLVWICILTIVFYSSDMFELCLRNYFQHINRPFSNSLNTIVQYILNYIYYIPMTIGMLCSTSARNFLVRSS